MRSHLPLSAAVLAGALLLTACGTQQSAGGGRGSGSTGADRCGLGGDPTPEAVDGVEITDAGGGPSGCGTDGRTDRSVRFRVTNHDTQPLTYTVEFEVQSPGGESLAHPKGTVPGVQPGRSADAEVDLGALVAPGNGARVTIYRVRSVPAAEAPAETGPCPPSGVRVYADRGDAAMGLRVVGLHLENCSDHPYRLSGYPQIQLLDLHRRPVAGVRVLHGSGGISTGTGFDDPPRAMTLAPGEQAASGLMWRNTLTSGAPVDVPYVRVVAQPGTPAVTVTPELDLGSTGKLGVSPWQRQER
jgi:hypothetical protein